MRQTACVLCITLLAGTAGAAVRKPMHPNWRAYRHEVAGKRAVTSSAVGAAGRHIINSPHEWGRGPSGYAKRFGSGLAQHAVKGTIEMGVGALHHENLHYQRSNLHGTLPRLGYAVKRTFIVPKTNKRGKTLALGRVSGNVGAGLISRAWQPASAAGVGAGLASGGIGLGADVGVNVAREFWPQKHRKIVHRRHRTYVARR